MSAVKDRSKVRLRSFLGRIFSSGSSNALNDSTDAANENSKINEISGPFNTVHRIHVGYDGQKFSGLPQSWLDILHRDLTEADQKKNPKAVVTALKFYASTLKQKQNEKFMITKSVYPSDDDIDVDLVIKKCENGTPRSKAEKIAYIHTVGSSSTLDSIRTSGSDPSSEQEKLPFQLHTIPLRTLLTKFRQPHILCCATTVLLAIFTTVCTSSAGSSTGVSPSTSTFAVPPVPATRSSLNKGSNKSGAQSATPPQVPMVMQVLLQKPLRHYHPNHCHLNSANIFDSANHPLRLSVQSPFAAYIEFLNKIHLKKSSSGNNEFLPLNGSNGAFDGGSVGSASSSKASSDEELHKSAEANITPLPRHHLPTGTLAATPTTAQPTADKRTVAEDNSSGGYEKVSVRTRAPPKEEVRTRQQPRIKLTDQEVLAELKQIVSEGDPHHKYTLLEKIGVGATGTVWTAKCLTSGNVVAVKSF
uniref:Non-specific serine/threonine protein kinase n=1 Tax=Ditylenchus dipsaci TaxID=166011 RepID=A0A915E033_9BILA